MLSVSIDDGGDKLVFVCHCDVVTSPRTGSVESLATPLEFQQVGDRGNDERSLLVDMSDVEMLTS